MRLCWTVFLVFYLAISVSAFARSGAVPVRGTPQSAASFRRELMNTQRAFLDAIDRGDADYVRNTVADDFMLIETNGDSSGKAELVHEVKPEKPGAKPILYDFNVVELSPDCAVVTYKAVFHGAPIDRYQHLSYTWVRQAGQWKLKFQQATVNLWSAHDLD
jgi:hypothetical protein